MKNLFPRIKTMVSIALIFCLVATVSTAVISSVKAVEVETSINSSYVQVEPNPAGVDVPVSIYGLIQPAPPSGSIYHDIAYSISSHNSGVVAQNNVTSDKNGIFYFVYIPLTVDDYYISIDYPGEQINNNQYSSCHANQVFTVRPDGFLINIWSDLQVTKGQSTTIEVGVYTWGNIGPTQYFDLSVPAGWPKGTTFSFNPTSISRVEKSTLTLTTSSQTPAEASSIVIQGKGAGFTALRTVGLFIGDFNASATPAIQNIAPGKSAIYSINLNSSCWIPWLWPDITLSISGLPNNANATFDPPKVALSSTTNSLNTSTLTITTPDKTNTKYYVTIKATGGANNQLVHETTVELNIVNESPVLPTLWIALTSGIAITAFLGFFTWRVIGKRHKLEDFSMTDGILPQGWQFCQGLTEGFVPGTVIRVSKEGRIKTVGTIDPRKIKIKNVKEFVGDYKQEGKVNTLIRFTGLKLKASGKSNIDQTLTLEMPGLIRETTEDIKLDPLVEDFLTNEKLDIRKNERYFVVYEARTTMEINYELNQAQVENLGGEASLNDIGLNAKNLSYSKESQVINQKFDEPMRVMYYAEEKKFRRVNNRIEIVH